AEASERAYVVDDVAGVLVADKEAAAEEVHDRHALRRDALGRMINVEQQVHVSALAEDDVALDAKVARVLLLLSACSSRDRGEGRGCREGAGGLDESSPADVLHVVVSRRTRSPILPRGERFERS